MSQELIDRLRGAKIIGSTLYAEAADLIERQAAQIAELQRALAYAIKEADDWHDDCRGGRIETPEMNRARKLLPWREADAAIDAATPKAG